MWCVCVHVCISVVGRCVSVWWLGVCISVVGVHVYISVVGGCVYQCGGCVCVHQCGRCVCVHQCGGWVGGCISVVVCQCGMCLSVWWVVSISVVDVCVCVTYIHIVMKCGDRRVAPVHPSNPFCRILMFEEKRKEKERPSGPPPKKNLSDLP